MKNFNRFGKLEEIKGLGVFFEKYSHKGTEFPRLVFAGKTTSSKGVEYKQTLVILETQEDAKEFFDVCKEALKLVPQLPAIHTLLEEKKGTKCSCGCSVSGNFCPNCGKPAAKPEVKPTCCGVEVIGKFCTQCGKSVGTTPAVHTTVTVDSADDLGGLGDVAKKKAVKRSK